MRTRLLLTVALMVSFVPPVLGAPQGATPSRPNSPEMRVVTDGAKNPERIPDHVAIGMFLSSIAIAADADRTTIAITESKIARLRLNRSDREILRREVAGLRTRLTTNHDALMASRGSGEGPPTRAAAEAASQARQALVMDSYTRLIELLSPGGRQKLAAYIATVKSQIKSFGPARR